MIIPLASRDERAQERRRMARGAGGRQSVVLLGAGGHGAVVCDALVSAGHRVVGWLDADRAVGEAVCGAPVLGTERDLPALLRRWGARRPRFIVTIGDNRRRAQLFEELLAAGLEPAIAIHPRATIARSARIGGGVMICAGAVVNPDATIGDNVILNTCASIDHDTVVERDAHCSPGVHTGGEVRIGRGAHIGLGAVILPTRTIGAWSTVGAGAVVDRDVPAETVVVGVPARAARSPRRA